jgi:hypothetical protein
MGHFFMGKRKFSQRKGYYDYRSFIWLIEVKKFIMFLEKDFR